MIKQAKNYFSITGILLDAILMSVPTYVFTGSFKLEIILALTVILQLLGFGIEYYQLNEKYNPHKFKKKDKEKVVDELQDIAEDKK